MRTVSGFTVSLVANLSPIYGIFGAFLIFGKSEIMTFYFYTGTLIILISVTAYPIMGLIKSKLEKHELKF
jgi:uncharacterized BrkB/YihY/UPF0761 family membrane protein